jgi:hypothetical protein
MYLMTTYGCFSGQGAYNSSIYLKSSTQIQHMPDRSDYLARVGAPVQLARGTLPLFSEPVHFTCILPRYVAAFLQSYIAVYLTGLPWLEPFSKL